jgi:hypothetical protein
MSVSLTVMTFNLHEDQAEDSPNSWEKRKDLCISVITNYSPMILCTQQGLRFSLYTSACVWSCFWLCFLSIGCSGIFHFFWGHGFLFFWVLVELCVCIYIYTGCIVVVSLTWASCVYFTLSIWLYFNWNLNGYLLVYLTVHFCPLFCVWI